MCATAASTSPCPLRSAHRLDPFARVFTDLQKIEQKITAQDYVKLSEFIGDMTKIFDNCRFYNPKESPFYRCAESLEGYFVQRIKHFREALTAADEKVAVGAVAAAVPAVLDESVTVPDTDCGDAAEETATVMMEEDVPITAETAPAPDAETTTL